MARGLQETCHVGFGGDEVFTIFEDLAQHVLDQDGAVRGSKSQEALGRGAEGSGCIRLPVSLGARGPGAEVMQGVGGRGGARGGREGVPGAPEEREDRGGGGGAAASARLANATGRPRARRGADAEALSPVLGNREDVLRGQAQRLTSGTGAHKVVALLARECGNREVA